MVDSPDEKSVLVERLLRRQSEPVGVINLKKFQTQLARVPSWIVQRSRFLERWQSRYAFGESEPGSGTELMLATPVQPITTEPNLTSQLSSVMSSERIYQEKIAPPIEKVSASQAGQTFRLSRKAVSLALDSNSLSKRVNSSEKIETPANTSEKNSPSLRTIVESVTVSNPDSKPAATLDQPQRTVAPKEEETKVTLVELKQIQVSSLSTPNPLLLRQNLHQPDETSEGKKIDSLTATSGESTSSLRTITERINTSTSNSDSAEISLNPETKVNAIEQEQSLVSKEATTNPLVFRKNLQQPEETSEEKKIDSLTATSGESTAPLRTITERINNPTSNSESAEISLKPETTVRESQKNIIPARKSIIGNIQSWIGTLLNRKSLTVVEQGQSLVSNEATTNPLVLRKNLQQPEETSEEKKIDSLTTTSGESTAPLRTINERINTSTSNSESVEISLKPETKVNAIEQEQSLVSNEAITNPLVFRKNLQQPDETSEEKKIDSLTATSGESTLPLRTITERINTSTSNSESAEISLKPETTVTAIEQEQSLVSNEAITNPLVFRKNLQQPDEKSEEKKIDSLTATSGESTAPLRTITERINTSTSNSESAEISLKPETTVREPQKNIIPVRKSIIGNIQSWIGTLLNRESLTAVEQEQSLVINKATTNPLVLRKNLHQPDETSEEKKIDSLTSTSGESTLPLRTITERINNPTSNSESVEISLKPETTVTAVEQEQSLVSNEAITNPLVFRKNLQEADEPSEEKKIDSLTATSGESTLPLRTITERINNPTSNSESVEISLKPETKVTAIEQEQSLVSNEATTNPLVLKKNLQQPEETSEEKKIDSLTATSGESTAPLRTINERINTSTSNSESAEISLKPETKVAAIEQEQSLVSNEATANPLVFRKNLQQPGATIQREAIGGQKQSGDQADRDIAAVNSELATTSIAVVPEIPSREVPGNLSVPTNLVWRKTTSEPARTVFSAANNGYTNSSLPSVSLPVNPNRPNILRQMSNTASEMEAMPSNPAIPAIAQTANQTPVVNVADIAEQVSRLLFRQLTVERERRGISQWH